MRVLAVDPGLTRCGVGVVDGVPGRRLTSSRSASSARPLATRRPRRLVAVEDEMRQWFDRHRPDAVAIERVFADTNVSTVMGTAQVTGIVMILAERLGLPVTLHTPTEVKAAVSGNGRADKAQVTTMVTRLLGLDTPPRPADAADALALAICHVWRGRHPDAPRGGPRGGRRSQRAPAGRHTPTGARGRPHRPHPAWSPATMIASLSGTVLKVGLDSARRRGRRRRHARAHHPRHGDVGAARPADRARDDPRRARGLAHPLRLRHRRREARLRDRADRLGRRPAPRPRGPRRAHARRGAGGPRHRRPRRADEGARHRQQGRRAPRARAQGQARRPARGRPRRSARCRSTRARCGASRSARRSSGSAGPLVRPTTRSTGSRPGRPRARASRRCCAPPCRSSVDDRRAGAVDELDDAIATTAAGAGVRGSGERDPERWPDGSFDATARIVDARTDAGRAPGRGGPAAQAARRLPGAGPRPRPAGAGARGGQAARHAT